MLRDSFKEAYPIKKDGKRSKILKEIPNYLRMASCDLKSYILEVHANCYVSKLYACSVSKGLHMKLTKVCKCKEHHFIHICQLNSDVESELIELLTNNPKVKCEHCGAEANSSSYVCMPIALSP